MLQMTPDTINVIGGCSAGFLSNLVGVPTDRLRIAVAQDMQGTKTFMRHCLETSANLRTAFAGGVARCLMKQTASTLNLLVPQDWRAESPYLCNAVVGCLATPILNVPRALQLGKVDGIAYPQTFRSFFLSGSSGYRKYALNTMMFMPGEVLGYWIIGFGMKDWLAPMLGLNQDPREINVPLQSLKMGLIAAPLIGAIETTSQIIFETLSTIHVKLNSDKSGSHQQVQSSSSSCLEKRTSSTPAVSRVTRSFTEVLKETITPKYMFRCWVGLAANNTSCNLPLFGIMFAADFYTKRYYLEHGGSSS